MDTLNILIPVVTLILGGGAAWFFTIKYTRRQAEADAMQHFQTVYQGLIKDLKEDRTTMRNECTSQINDLKIKVSELERVVENNTKVIKQLSRLACVKAPQCTDCVLIDISQF